MDAAIADKRKLAEKFGMAVYEDLSTERLPREIYQKVPYAFVKKHTLLPIQEIEGTIITAIDDPLLMEPLEELRHMLERPISAVYSPKEVILQAIHECYNQEQGAASKLIADMQQGDHRDDAVETYDLLETSASQSPIIRLLNLLLTEAIQQGASDIHFEPYDNSLRVRYRIDGVLQNRHAPAQEYQSQLLTRIKVMAKLDIAERRLPQDGRIKLKMGSREIDFRVSTVPVAGGERIVLRILDRGNVILGMDKIGMPEQVYQEFSRLLRLPEGIVFVTGPTGSGKTTTLYSGICGLNNDATNIMTIEDPVEYNLKGIAQIGVNPKIQLDFSRGLRHILRQDPDVIMIGEIRDQETAEIAIQASLTGHLVLSTLHTNDAPSAITRLVDMGIEPYLLSSTIVGVLAQRLVRRICIHCKEQVADGYRGKGCNQCFQSGYKGRHGIYELMTVTNSIKNQIVKSPDAVEMRRMALEQGMKTLFDHGMQLVEQGVTTREEVMRVTQQIDGEQ